MSMTYVYGASLVIAAAVILSDVYSKDTSSMRHSGSVSSWPAWGAAQKNSTTPWPALERHQVNSGDNNPIWVRPDQRQTPSDSFNLGSRDGGSRRRNPEPTVSQTSEVQDSELRELSEALLAKDVNNAARYVTVNLQGRTSSRSPSDEAPLPLLTVDEEAHKIPSIKSLLLLYDNYVVESNANEHYTPQEKIEEENLLDAIINTPVMEHARNFLIRKGKLGSDPREFRDVLREIWFYPYARGGRKVGSSGFEHVFLAEIKNNVISGLHNWLYFDEEEKHHRANYLGYMKKLDLGNKGAVLKYHFTFRGVDKPVGSIFIGTSPEFEMSLYTVCFLLRADQICPVKLDDNRFVIRTYTYRYRGKNMIGSAFPDI